METIFRQLPENIFKPLATPNKQLYSRLLLYLYREVLGDMTGNLPSKRVLIQEIAQYLENWQTEYTLQDDVEDDLAKQDADQRRSSVYRRLVETGWLIEHRDGYRQLVDFNAEARLLLQEIGRIESGQAQSYGSAVINVLSNMESAFGNPEDRSEGISNAARFSGEFLQHIRTVAAAVRKMEELIIKQKDLHNIFESFFDDYVEKYLIRDIKTLHTQNNPFRFKNKIVALVYDLYEDEVKRYRLENAYIKEGRSPDRERASALLFQELRIIETVFENIDQNLRIIENTNLRLQRRISNTVRYMDRVGYAAVDRIKEAIRTVAALPLGMKEEVDVSAPVPLALRPVGIQDLYQKPSPKADIEQRVIRKRKPDPALRAYEAAKREFFKQVMPSKAHIASFLEKALGDSNSVDAKDITIETLDDFVVFQRLRELPYLYGGVFADHYAVEMKEGMYESDWLECRDFTIRRIDISRKQAA